MLSRKGFTLIELLVVIAIIGLLAGIVLVSLNGAQDRARDGRIQAAIGQTKAQAQLVYAYNNAFDYTSLCDVGNTLNTSHAAYGPALLQIENEVNTQNGTSGAEPVCMGSASNFCISATLATSGTVMCIDETGGTGTTVCAAASGVGSCN
ncbi:MAG: hypothetical protein A2748_03400 [Candidatus Wildermuthbacteria bacterium RIFCSPHIGHO2_01_FULL_45_20]|nr:MAG: hypothetical protein A2748_03400 [Candidatus Wildermuthbacteria bacterium RIFCSPHIGHO2_01_FULL_45_20]